MRYLADQKGFTLVQAVFILVVLALLGVAMMRLGSVQSSGSTFAVQGARAYQAALGGLEWGAARASTGASCDGTFNLEEFSLTVSCSSADFVEGASGTTIYHIESVAAFGSYGTPDYVQRRLEMKVKMP